MPKTKHRIRWYALSGGERIPRTHNLRGTWGYDAECSCGWATRTGGAVERYIRDEIWMHKRIEHSAI